MDGKSRGIYGDSRLSTYIREVMMIDVRGGVVRGIINTPPSAAVAMAVGGLRLKER
jgi:hypothetical protein